MTTKNAPIIPPAKAIKGIVDSKEIQGVEEKLGIRLFHRTTRSVSLTEEGIVYIGYIRESYKLAVMAEEAVSQSC